MIIKALKLSLLMLCVSSTAALGRPTCSNLNATDVQKAKAGAASNRSEWDWLNAISDIEKHNGVRYTVCVAYQVLDWARQVENGAAIGRALVYLNAHGERAVEQSPHASFDRHAPSRPFIVCGRTAPRI